MHGARPMRSTRRLQNLQSSLPCWWSITNKAADNEPSLVSIYDEIGFYGVSAQGFLAELSGITGPLDVHISSPGGDVFDAIAIYNSLKARKHPVAVTIDGIAASAASFIAQAASPGMLEMAPFSSMMIHDGFAGGIGNASDMRELADQLDMASNNIAGIYAARSGKPVDYWRAKMRATTWFTDAEAVADGLADRVRGQDQQPSNAWDLSVFKNAGPVDLGDGWVSDPDGSTRFDPDGDGDDDSTPEGDTDHDYFDADGKQIKDIPPCPAAPGRKQPAARSGAGAAKKTKRSKAKNTAVDDSPWDADKAWHNGAVSDNPEAFYRGICAGKKNGNPDTRDGWALPYKYHPDDPPNAAGVRAALARLSQTQGLTNKGEAQGTLEAAMKKVNPDYHPGDMDAGLLSAVLIGSLEGSR